MLTYKEALEKLANTVQKQTTVKKDLENILNHILAEPIEAAFDLPRFNNSAMDGYGVKAADLEDIENGNSRYLNLVGTIEAGSQLDLSIKAGEAVKIFTGAKVPDSVDTVVMKEYCQEETNSVLVKTKASPGANIRIQGEEFKKGDPVLEAGIKITPPVLGLLATFGYKEFLVFEQPKIAILGTGNEVVEPGGSLTESQIYDSNSYALAAAVEALGFQKPLRLHADDTEAEIEAMLKKAFEEADLVVTAGGVSVGDKDLVKSVLENKLGVNTVFWRAKVKPGKPIYFGEKTEAGKQKLFFGLPGNPVSALVTFNLFVKPALAIMQGKENSKDNTLKAQFMTSRKKKPGRLDFVRGILKGTENASLNTLPTTGQDSHMLSGLAKANCLIHFDEELNLLNEGDLVSVQELKWRDY